MLPMQLKMPLLCLRYNFCFLYAIIPSFASCVYSLDRFVFQFHQLGMKNPPGHAGTGMPRELLWIKLAMRHPTLTTLHMKREYCKIRVTKMVFNKIQCWDGLSPIAICHFLSVIEGEWECHFCEWRDSSVKALPSEELWLHRQNCIKSSRPEAASWSNSFI